MVKLIVGFLIRKDNDMIHKVNCLSEQVKIIRHPFWMRFIYSFCLCGMNLLIFLSIYVMISSNEVEAKRILMVLMIGMLFLIFISFKYMFILGVYTIYENRIDFQLFGRFFKSIYFEHVVLLEEFEIEIFKSKYGESISAMGFAIVDDKKSIIKFSRALNLSEVIISRCHSLLRDSVI
jgi:hypothetical protein